MKIEIKNIFKNNETLGRRLQFFFGYEKNVWKDYFIPFLKKA